MAGDEIYQALALPDEVLANGGTEILRAGIVDGELYVTARRAFKDHAKWGDVLADIARRLALIYSAEDAELNEEEILTDIVEAIAGDLGAKKVPAKKVRARKVSAKTRPRATARKASASARTASKPKRRKR